MLTKLIANITEDVCAIPLKEHTEEMSNYYYVKSKIRKGPLNYVFPVTEQSGVSLKIWEAVLKEFNIKYEVSGNDKKFIISLVK